ncbi:MAG: virulence factor Mce family protein [Solirubrobacterales bacterium]|nr:virulence factor Mce family protein [Solirubrobacterales bacterium]
MNRRGTILPQLLSLLGFTAVAVAWALFLLAKGGGLPSFGSDAYEISAVIPTGAALAPGSRVTMAGVDVGRVKKVKREGVGALLKLEIKDKSVLPLASDSRVQVRQHTPVGENYIALVAGRSTRKLASGDALGADQADEFVDVDKVLSVLKGPTRQRARQTIRGLGGALHGRGDEFNALLSGAGRFLRRPAPQVVDVLYRDRAHAARLVDQLGDVAASIGQRDAAITTIANQGLTSLTALNSRNAALRDIVGQLPSTMRSVRSATGTVKRVSTVARPVVDDAALALTALQPAVARLQPAADAGRGVVNQLSAAAPGLRTTLQQVTKLSPPLSATLPKVHKTICELAPIIRYARPYVHDALGIVVGLGSASNSYDATGHLIRLLPVDEAGFNSGLPDSIVKARQTLLNSGLISAVTGGNHVNFNPYPKPGDVGRVVATSGVPIGPEEMSKAGYTYPRIEADC